uniref:Methyltransferase domain-containing protein n=1 Tax=Eutreptiella gymnastica TaxID=73025 RepID=A0A7S1IUL9_9EUGL
MFPSGHYGAGYYPYSGLSVYGTPFYSAAPLGSLHIQPLMYTHMTPGHAPIYVPQTINSIFPATATETLADSTTQKVQSLDAPVDAAEPPRQVGVDVPKIGKDGKPGKTKKIKFQSTGAKKVYCTPTKARLMDFMPQYVQEGDNVLCIGLDMDTLDSLKRLSRSGKVIALDMEHGVPNAPKPQEDVDVLLMDAWDTLAIQALGCNFEVAVLDIAQWSGRDSLLDSISLLNNYWQAFPSLRIMICKSKALLQMGQKLIDGKLLDAGQKLTRLHLDKDAASGECKKELASPQAEPAKHWHAELTKNKIVATVGVLEYRATIPHVIRDGDVVLEVGCQAGLTTKLIKQANPSGRVVGSDVGASSIKHAINQGKGYDVEWVVLDAWDLAGIAKLGMWTVIYVDISGISGRNSVQDALALLFSYFRLLPSLRTVVIKSRSIRDLSGRFVRLDSAKKPPATAQQAEPDTHSL